MSLERTVAAPAQALWAAMRARAWPYDVGDDPSFFMARTRNSAVTWGVCRPDVRNAIDVGDVVVFFAADFSDDSRRIDYRLVAALTVEAKLSYPQIFEDEAFRTYWDYLNLVARPLGSGWEHFEPSVPPSEWHGDWIWRVAENRGLKATTVEAGRRHVPGAALEVRSSPVAFAQNYVVFSNDPEKSLILDKPLRVARRERPAVYEVWLSTKKVQAIRRLTLGLVNHGRTSPRHLRTSNTNQPHRHSRAFLSDPTAWLRDVRLALALE